MISHWDEQPWQRMKRGHIAGDRLSPTGDSSVTVGVKRIRNNPGAFAVRAGSTVARPAGMRVAHSFRTGVDGLPPLAYGTRDPRDIAYYPRSDKVRFRGVGSMTRVVPLDHREGED